MLFGDLGDLGPGAYPDSWCIFGHIPTVEKCSPKSTGLMQKGRSPLICTAPASKWARANFDDKPAQGCTFSCKQRLR